MIRRFCVRLSQVLRGVPRKAWLSCLLLCVIFWWRFFYFLIKKKDFKSALHIYLGSWLYVKLGFLLPMKLFLDMSGGRFPPPGFWLAQHIVFLCLRRLYRGACPALAGQKRLLPRLISKLPNGAKKSPLCGDFLFGCYGYTL